MKRILTILLATLVISGHTIAQEDEHLVSASLAKAIADKLLNDPMDSPFVIDFLRANSEEFKSLDQDVVALRIKNPDYQRRYADNYMAQAFQLYGTGEFLYLQLKETLGCTATEYSKMTIKFKEDANLSKESEIPSKEPDTDEDVSIIPQVGPRFNGGDASEFAKWAMKNVQYPAFAEENGIMGKVVVQFVVDTNGNVADVKVVRGVHPVLDKEAVRVVSSSPQWTPGSTNGEPVSVTLTMPVIFSLR